MNPVQRFLHFTRKLLSDEEMSERDKINKIQKAWDKLDIDRYIE